LHDHVHDRLIGPINHYINNAPRDLILTIVKAAMKFPYEWTAYNNIMGTYIKIADPNTEVPDEEIDKLAKFLVKMKPTLDSWTKYIRGLYSDVLVDKFEKDTLTVFNEIKYADTRSNKIIAIDKLMGMAHISESSLVPALSGYRADVIARVYIGMGKMTQGILTHLFEGDLSKELKLAKSINKEFISKAHQLTPPFPGAVFDEQKHRWVQTHPHDRLITHSHLWQRASRTGFHAVKDGIKSLRTVDLPKTGWWHPIKGDGYIVGNGQVVKTILSANMHPNGVKV
ncbi:MAG: hypothetical protein ABIC57_02480, partial [bacterium]